MTKTTSTATSPLELLARLIEYRQAWSRACALGQDDEANRAQEREEAVLRALFRLDSGALRAEVESAAQAQALAEKYTIPPEIAQIVAQIGPALWSQTPAHSTEEHLKWFADSIRITAEVFKQGDAPQPMSMIYAEIPGQDDHIMLGYIGTGPNSPVIARALAGAWNYLLEQCQAMQTAPTPCSDCGKVVPNDTMTLVGDVALVCEACADEWRALAAGEPTPAAE